MNAKIMLLAALTLGITLSKVHAIKQVNESVELQQDQVLEINLKFGDSIKVIPVEDHHFVLSGTVEVNDGDDDDAYRIEVKKKANRVIVDSDLDDDQTRYRRVQVFDDEGNLISTSCDIEIDAEFELKIPVGHALTLKTINADLEVGPIDAPLEAKTINGNIHCRFYPNDANDISIKTIHGDCLTDIDAKQLEVVSLENGFVTSEAEFRLNQGGEQLQFETINGWIFLHSVE